MKATSVSTDELAAYFGLQADLAGCVTFPAIATLVRGVAGRWSLTRRATLLRFVQRVLDAGGFDDLASENRIRETVDALVALGDLEQVFIGGTDDGQRSESYSGDAYVSTQGAMLAATRPRQFKLGDRRLLLGLTGLRDPVPVVHYGADWSPASVARWASNDEQTVAQLEAAGFDECDIHDWIGVPDWLPHLERRRASGAAELADLWSVLIANLDEFGMSVGDPTAFTVVAGDPGRYFGRPEECDGRWVAGDAAPDGAWCGLVHGHGTRHLRPVVVEAKGGRIVRSLDLFDQDEFRWALLARGLQHRREIVRVSGGRLQFTFPCPDQWRRVAALCEVEKWRWTLPTWVAVNDIAAAFEGALLHEAPEASPG